MALKLLRAVSQGAGNLGTRNIGAVSWQLSTAGQIVSEVEMAVAVMHKLGGGEITVCPEMLTLPGNVPLC